MARVNSARSKAFWEPKARITKKPARSVNVIPISGALANCPLDLASVNRFSVGGSVLELLSTSDMGQRLNQHKVRVESSRASRERIFDCDPAHRM